jgi:putative ABC transport system permease protein
MAEKELAEGKIDLKKLADENEVLIINNTPGRNDFKVTNLKVGDTLKVRKTTLEGGRFVQGEELELKIGGIIKDVHINTGRSIGITIIAHEALFRKLTGSDSYKQFDIKVKEDADRSYAENSLLGVAGRISNGKLVSFDEEISRLKNEKKQMEILLYGLVGMIALIGVFSIINTISTNLVLRTREFGTLRAVGMTNSQIKKMVRIEGLYYGLISSFWGIIAASVLSYMLFQLVKSNMTYLEWSIPWKAMLLACAGSILLGIGATVLPVRRISSMSIIESIRIID